ncbi:MAG: GNAT family N-acetyltransferase [Chloroflexi bacterium]|nr:GNAT family N-acetyltransferase [Chloroflexota bacterium]
MQNTIREAVLSDVEAIAQVHVASWQSTYPGILPDEVIENRSLEQRVQYWQETLETLPEDRYVMVCEYDRDIAGFAWGGPERGRHPDYEGEIYAIYLVEEAQGLGHGQQLVQAMVRKLLEAGISTMLIWVAKENDSRYFYEAIGGVAVAKDTIKITGAAIEEIGYGWDDIRILLE